jgi:hypothetical protein
MFATDRAWRIKGYPQTEAINSGVNSFTMRSRNKCNSFKVENSSHLRSFLRACQSLSMGFNSGE